MLRILAASKPFVPAVDDVQWLDRSSAAVWSSPAGDFARNGGASSRAPAMLRLDSERLSWPSGGTSRRGRVGPLSMGALHRLLRDRLGVDARPAGADAESTRHQAAIRSTRSSWFAPLKSGGGSNRAIHCRCQTLDAILHERLEALPARRARRPRRGGGAEAADRVDPRRLAGAGAGVRGGHHRAADDKVSFSHPLLASAVRVDHWPRSGATVPSAAEVVTDPEERARTWRSLPRSPTRGANALADAARRGLRGARPAAADGAGRARGAPDAARNGPASSECRGGQVPPRAGELARSDAIPERSIKQLPPGWRASGRVAAARERATELRAVPRARGERSRRGSRMTTPASRRSSATSPSYSSFRARPSRRSSTPGRAGGGGASRRRDDSRDCALDRRLVRDASRRQADARIARAAVSSRSGKFQYEATDTSSQASRSPCD